MEHIQTFHQSINEFPVKTTEDEQNERLRKIHTFQASFDDFVSYVNQRIKDTKQDNVMAESTLFSFAEFVNEKYQEFIDPDTCEIVTLWVDDPDPEEEKKKLEKAKEYDKKYEAACKKEKEYFAKLNPLEDELWGYTSDLKNCQNEYRQLKIDMEEEVGQLYAQSRYDEGEQIAQTYGVSIERLEKQIKTLKRNIKSVQSKINTLRKSYENIWDF